MYDSGTVLWIRLLFLEHSSWFLSQKRFPELSVMALTLLLWVILHKSYYHAQKVSFLLFFFRTTTKNRWLLNLSKNGIHITNHHLNQVYFYLSFLKDILKFYVYECLPVSVCMFTICLSGACGRGHQTDPLELKSQQWATMWVLQPEPGSPRRTANDFKLLSHLSSSYLLWLRFSKHL